MSVLCELNLNSIFYRPVSGTHRPRLLRTQWYRSCILVRIVFVPDALLTGYCADAGATCTEDDKYYGTTTQCTPRVAGLLILLYITTTYTDYCGGGACGGPGAKCDSSTPYEHNKFEVSCYTPCQYACSRVTRLSLTVFTPICVDSQSLHH